MPVTLIERLQAEVQKNLQNEKFGVEELAESIGMSRSNLHRRLQETTGQSVSQFIREFRLEKSLDILKSHQFTVSEVAHKVGFSSPSYFSKRFAEYYGYPPVEVTKRSEESGSKETSKTKTYGYLIAGFLLTCFYLVYHFTVNTNDPTGQPSKPITIAVLPFKNMNADQENQYFTDGVMEAILNKLAKIEAISVISRTSVEQFRDTDKTIPEIGLELQTDYVLEGGAQKYGQEVKVTVQLISVQNDVHIWSQEYIRTFSDILFLQGEIAQRVADELSTSLSVKEKEELRGLATSNVEAYNYLLKGNDQSVNRSTRKGIETAFTFFKKAIELDPHYVDAHLELANLWVVSGAAWGIKPQSAWDSAQLVLDKILALDPSNGKAYQILAAGQYLYDWDFENAAINFDKAHSYSIHTDDHWDFDFYTKMGSYNKVLSLVEEYIRQNPLISRNYYGKAQALYFLGQKEEAIDILDEVNSQFDDFLSQRECVKLYLLYGEQDKFLSTYQKLLTDFKDRPPLVIWFGAMEAILNHREAEPFIKQLEDMYEHGSSGSPAWFTALTYASLKDMDNLFYWLERSFERREVEMTWLKTEPVLDPFRQDPRYIDLLSRMKFL